MYLKHVECFWNVDEINLLEDIGDWENKLDKNERNFIKKVLSFFVSSDTIVVENLVLNFMRDTEIQEARFFYGV